MGLFAGALPFMENPTPHGAEDNDAGHVQRPACEAEPAHLRLAHGVEEELEVPCGAGQRAEEVIAEHWHRIAGETGGSCGVLDDFLAGSVHCGFNDRLLVTSRRGIAEGAAEVLVAGPILEVEESAPDEVGGKPAEQYHNQLGQPAPDDSSSGDAGGFADGIAGGEGKGEARAHDARERGNHDALGEIEFCDRLFLFRLGHFLFLRQPGQRGHPDTRQANKHTEQSDFARRGGGNLRNAFRDGDVRQERFEDRRDECSEGGAISQRDAHTQ